MVEEQRATVESVGVMFMPYCRWLGSTCRTQGREKHLQFIPNTTCGARKIRLMRENMFILLLSIGYVFVHTWSLTFTFGCVIYDICHRSFFWQLEERASLSLSLSLSLAFTLSQYALIIVSSHTFSPCLMSEDFLDDPKVSRHDTPITSCLMIPRPHEPTKSII